MITESPDRPLPVLYKLKHPPLGVDCFKVGERFPTREGRVTGFEKKGHFRLENETDQAQAAVFSQEIGHNIYRD